jgi:small subunit ribosomal protein S18
VTSEKAKGKSYRRYSARRKVCPFCADKNLVIDYKDPSKLRRFLTDRAKIEPRRKTGTCARHQRKLTTAIKRARLLAMLPFTGEHIRWSGGVGVRTAEERRRARDERRSPREVPEELPEQGELATESGLAAEPETEEAEEVPAEERGAETDRAAAAQP